MEHLVSVVVPVYNMEKLVSKCIESILAQTYSNIELLLINDGSTDASGQICDKFALNDNRIKVFHKENGGVADATNVGLNNMSGKYVLFVDSDDYIMETMLEKMVSALEKETADVVQCGIRLIDELGNIINEQKGNTCVIENNENIFEKYFYDTIIGNNLACKLYKSELFADVRLTAGRNIVDLTTVPQILSKCNKYIIIEDCLYNNIKTSNSVSRGGFTEKKFDDLIYSASFLEEFVGNNYPEMQSFIYYNNVYTALRCYNLIKRNGDFSKQQERKLIHRCQKLFNSNYKNYRKYTSNSLGNSRQKLGFWLFSINPIFYYVVQVIRWH